MRIFFLTIVVPCLLCKRFPIHRLRVSRALHANLSFATSVKLRGMEVFFFIFIYLCSRSVYASRYLDSDVDSYGC